MNEFQNLTIIHKGFIDYITDKTSKLVNLINFYTDTNTHYLLNIVINTELYVIDLGLWLVHNSSLVTVDTTISELVELLTYEMIISFRSTVYSYMKYIQSFNNGDIDGNTTISIYNHLSDETSTTFNPGFDDLVISNPNLDLSACLPVINDRLRFCQKGVNKLVLEGRKELIKSTSSITFLRLPSSINYELIQLNTFINSGATLSSSDSILLVIQGRLFYWKNSFFNIVYSDRSTKQVIFNNEIILNLFDGDDITSILSDNDSFVIIIKNKELLVREIPSFNIEDNSPIYQYYDNTDTKHLNLIAINESNIILNTTAVDSRYNKLISPAINQQHYFYVNDFNNNVKLIQLVLV